MKGKANIKKDEIKSKGIGEGCICGCRVWATHRCENCLDGICKKCFRKYHGYCKYCEPLPGKKVKKVHVNKYKD